MQIKSKDIYIFGIIMIPIFTIIFGFFEPPTNYTLSMIGNWFNFRFDFIIWGIFTATLIVLFLNRVTRHINLRTTKQKLYIYLTGLFLILAVITPTRIRHPVEKSLRHIIIDLHLFWSVLFAIFLLLSLYFLIKYFEKTNNKFAKKSTTIFWITIGGSLFLLFIFGMTGIFEIFFFTVLAIYFYLIETNVVV